VIHHQTKSPSALQTKVMKFGETRAISEFGPAGSLQMGMKLSPEEAAKSLVGMAPIHTTNLLN
jgi:hypothetical protein